MALTKRQEEVVTVLADGQLQVLEITIYSEDGEEVARRNHRYVVDVGDDTNGRPAFVREIATAIHTQARIDARENVKNK